MKKLLFPLFAAGTLLFASSARACSDTASLSAVTERAQALGEEMGILKSVEVLDVYAEGCVPTEINGETVPSELYTEEERESVASARRLQRLMEGGVKQEGDQHQDEGRVFESDEIHPSAY